MYGASDPAAADRTAFRRAEKQYKLYKPPNLKGRSRSRSKPDGVEGGCGDLSAVVDFHALLAADGELPPGSAGATALGSTTPCSASWTGRDSISFLALYQLRNNAIGLGKA